MPSVHLDSAEQRKCVTIARCDAPPDTYASDAAASIRNRTAATASNIINLDPVNWARFIYDGTNWKIEDSGPLTGPT